MLQYSREDWINRARWRVSCRFCGRVATFGVTGSARAVRTRCACLAACATLCRRGDHRFRRRIRHRTRPGRTRWHGRADASPSSSGRSASRRSTWIFFQRAVRQVREVLRLSGAAAARRRRVRPMQRRAPSRPDPRGRAGDDRDPRPCPRTPSHRQSAARSALSHLPVRRSPKRTQCLPSHIISCICLTGK
jgi:hypothetical protein